MIAAELRAAVGDTLFEIWLAPLRVVSYDGHELVLGAPAQTRAPVTERFGRVLRSSVASILGPEVALRFTDEVGAAPTRGTADRAGGPPRVQPSARHETPLNPKYSFDQFVIGPGNRFAHAAALAVAENPATAYNPLFVCGPPGVGKSHLLHSIGNYLELHAPGLRVRVASAETFVNEFLAALRGNQMDAFKVRYRHNDVLLIDDVQFLMAKAKTEEEFFHTFNALRDGGGQLVLTCDRPPRDLVKLEDRLRDRFEAGLVAAVEPPDLRTRLAALHKRALHDGLDVADERVFDVIADRVTNNLRALEGALIRVVAYGSLTGRQLSAELAVQVLDQFFPRTPGAGTGRARPTIEDVQSAVCEAFGITADELRSPSRAARLVVPRQVAMYLAREHTGASLPAIGARFGGRGHTTVMHACKRTSERITQDPETSRLVQELSTRLQAPLGDTRADRAD